MPSWRFIYFFTCKYRRLAILWGLRQQKSQVCRYIVRFHTFWQLTDTGIRIFLQPFWLHLLYLEAFYAVISDYKNMHAWNHKIPHYHLHFKKSLMLVSSYIGNYWNSAGHWQLQFRFTDGKDAEFEGLAVHLAQYETWRCCVFFIYFISKYFQDFLFFYLWSYCSENLTVYWINFKTQFFSKLII